MILFLGELILLFIIFIISVRFLGKAALAQLTPFDFGAIIFLTYLAFGPIEVKGPIQGIVGMIVITLLHFLISKLNLYKWFNYIITGEPTILIKHGKLIPMNLKSTRYSLMELLSTIRAAGVPDIEDIEYAILEPNGEITILPQVDLVPVTPRLLKIDTEYKGLPIAVILEGKIQHKNLELIHKDETWLFSELEKKGSVFVKIVVAFSLFTSVLLKSNYRASLAGLLQIEQSFLCSIWRRVKGIPAQLLFDAFGFFYFFHWI